MSNTRRVKHARAQYTYININTNININEKILYYNYCTRSHPGRTRFLLGLSKGFRASSLSFVFLFSKRRRKRCAENEFFEDKRREKGRNDGHEVEDVDVQANGWRGGGELGDGTARG